VFEALAPLCGRDKALNAVREAVAGLSRAWGAEMAAQAGEERDLGVLDTLVELWSYDGALTVRDLGHDETRYDFDVTRCAYAEMYKRLGLAELGVAMSCQRDFAFFEGFNPRIKLTRTQTIMEGADTCDFRFRLAKG
jgi:predicted ArsR family transcriptional regulator